MDGPIGIAATVVAALGLGGAFGVVEAALRELGDAWLQAEADRPSPWFARTATAILRARSRYRTTCLIGQVVGAVAAGAVTIPLWLGARPSWAAVLLDTFIVAFLYGSVLVLGGAFARKWAGSWVLTLVRLLTPVTWVLSPVAWILEGLRRVVGTRPNGHRHVNQERITEIGLEQLIEGGAREGALAAEQAELLRNVLEFKNTVAHEVMVPRTRMVAFEQSQLLADVLETIIAKGHSRYPVYRDTADQVVGLLYVKDVFSALRATTVGAEPAAGRTVGGLARRAVFYATEGQKIGALLREMQAKRVHLAIVVDEFGGTSGVLTLEDILEEIVGDIRDEYDKDLGQVLRVGHDRYLVDAGISVYDLEDQYDLTLRQDEKGDFDSLGGLLIDVAGYVPAIGDSLQVGDYMITVRDSDAKHVRRVEIRRRPEVLVNAAG